MDMPAPLPVRVRVLGGFELIGADGGDLTPSGRKLRALLAVLALAPETGWPRERLTALLWGDREEEQARGSLRQALVELRHLLGDQALLASRDNVSLDEASLRVDALEFAALSKAGAWAEAAALYRGELLDGVNLPNGSFADWLLVERTHLHDLAIRTLANLLETQTGDPALATARRLLELDPTREETHRALMQLYAARGDRAQAIRQYQICCEHLQRELGVKPEPETQCLFKKIQESPRLPSAPATPPSAQPEPAATIATGDVLHGQGARNRTSLVQRWLAGAMLMLLAGVIAVVWWQPWKMTKGTASIVASPSSGPPTVAILPFENLGDDPEQDYFAAGITDDLMTDLSRVKGLFVIARHSTFAYRGKEVDVRQVARDLGVRYVIEGSVRRAGDRVRINVQLVDAATGGQQWAERYDGSIADIFALQDQATGAVVGALSLRLTAGEERELARHETASMEAYDAFLRGWDRYRRATPDELVKAIPHFQQAIELDPAYGRAHAALAMIYFQAYDQGWAGSLGLSADDTYRRARDHLKIAKQQPTSTAHQVAGNMSRALGWYEDALKEFKAASALDPNDSWTYAYAAHTLISAGRPAEAEAQIRMAMRIDPNPPPKVIFFQGLAALSQDRLAEAAAAFDKATQLNPDDPWPWLYLVATYGNSGRLKEARASLMAFNGLRIRQGGTPLTLDCYYLRGDTLLLSAWQHTMYMSMYMSIGKYGLQEGLRRAGVPRWFESRMFDEQRLKPKEIDSLFFGHRLHGRSLESGQEHGASVAADGSAIMFGDWGFGNGIARFDGDQLCFEWTGGHMNCGSVYRNIGGTKAKENEYIWFSHKGGGFPFSQVD